MHAMPHGRLLYALLRETLPEPGAPSLMREKLSQIEGRPLGVGSDRAEAMASRLPSRRLPLPSDSMSVVDTTSRKESAPPTRWLIKALFVRARDGRPLKAAGQRPGVAMMPWT